MFNTATGAYSLGATTNVGMRSRLALFLLCMTAACLALAVQTGSPSRLPDFEFKLLDGTAVKSSDLKGKIVVVEFWGTWCKPCLEEIPDFNSFYSKFKERGVFFVALAVDSGTADKVQEATKRLGIQYPIAAPSLKDLDVFGDMEAVPTTWIVDRAGKVQTVFVGASPGKQRALRETVDRLLKD